jgi:hypothetical protein
MCFSQKQVDTNSNYRRPSNKTSDLIVKMLILRSKHVSMARLMMIVLLICIGAMTSVAQDTVKKRGTVRGKVPNPYKHRTYRQYWKKADSVAHSPVQPAARPLTPVPAVAATAPNDKSLNGQYQYLLSKVYHYQEPLISALWKNASDTLNANRAKLNAATGRINAQNKEIDSLKTTLGSQGDDLNTVTARQNGMDIFGMIIPKTTYNVIVWGLIILLGLATFGVISRSAAHGREARYRTQLYSELDEEYKAFKAKANEKEKKLARELQTERNKLDELLGRG